MIRPPRKSKSKRATRRPGTLFPIRDVLAFRALIDEAIEQAWAGSERRAARESGLSQSWLNRVRRGDGGTEVEFAVWEALFRLVPNARHAELDDLFISQQTREGLGRGYTRWESRAAVQRSVGTGYWWRREGGAFIETRAMPDESGVTQRDLERARLWEHVRRRWGSLAERFDGLVARRELGPAERDAALARVLDPLIDGYEAAFGLPVWRELHANKLRSFVTLGIRREELYLSSVEPTWRRLSYVASLTDKDFAARFGSADA